MELVAQASTGQQALDLYRSTLPDVALIDLQLPDMDGLEVVGKIRNEFPESRLIILTTYGGDVRAQRALRAGARAYMMKHCPPQEMLDTIRAVHKGQKRVQPEVAMQLAAHATDQPLTERELQVLHLLVDGNSNREVAVALGIHEETAKGHVKNVLAKMGARDRTQAVMMALKRGFIEQ